MKIVASMLFCLAAALGSLSLSSCTTWKPVVLPSGQRGYTVDCSGTNLSWSHCYQKAGKACPHGYDITQRTGSHGGKVVPGDLFGVLGGSVQDRSLLILCRHDDSVRDDTGPVDAGRTPPRPPTAGAITFPLGSGPAVHP
ncbi:MAG: hypothetical protein EPN38_03685 [Rhodanobacteraceae bacterium]|nr:MAG: hypothetical protein EPN38_03685 [Rhodanobacteraceae bacterium]